MLRLVGAAAALWVGLTVSTAASEAVASVTSTDLQVVAQNLDTVGAAADPVLTGSLTQIDVVDDDSSPTGVIVLLGAALLGLGFLGRSRTSVA